MNYKAVLFDLDGTLLDTLEDLADSMNAVLASRGWPVHPVDSYRYFVGDGFEVLARRTLPAPHGNDDRMVRECVSEAQRVYSQRWKQKSRLYPGVPELLDVLAARGILFAILSNKPDPFVGEIARHFFGKWHFSAAQGAKPDVPRKPDPAAALEICRSLAVPAESFLYLGDTNTDMRTAIAAGMFPVGALWGFRPEQELRDSGARALVRSPLDVLALL